MVSYNTSDVAIRLTVAAITKNGITKLATPAEPDLSKYKTDKKIEDEEILEILQRPLARSTGSKSNKNKKKKNTNKSGKGDE